MSSPQARSWHRERCTIMVEKFCKRYGMSINPLNNGYQLRVENLVDFYPTNGRYCILQSGERGDFDTFADMKNIMLKALPDRSPRTFDVKNGEQPIAGINMTGVNKAVIHNVNTEPVTTFKPRWYQGKVWDYVNKRFPKTMVILRWRGRRHL